MAKGKGKGLKSKPFDVAAFAQESTTYPGQRCVTCHHPEVAKVVADFLAYKREHGSAQSLINLYRRVREHFPDYAVSDSGFRNHIRRCCGGWDQDE